MALILIMAGVVLLIASLDIPGFTWVGWDRAWGLIMVGAALLLALEIAVRMMMPKYAAPLRGRIILASILAIIGLDNLFDVPLWPLIIIAIGVSVLFRAFTGQAR